jgi:hypothetical protein
MQQLGAYSHNATQIHFSGLPRSSRPMRDPTAAITSFHPRKRSTRACLPTCDLTTASLQSCAAAYHATSGKFHSLPCPWPLSLSVTTRIHSSIPRAEGKNGSAAQCVPASPPCWTNMGCSPPELIPRAPPPPLRPPGPSPLVPLRWWPELVKRELLRGDFSFVVVLISGEAAFTSACFLKNLPRASLQACRATGPVGDRHHCFVFLL